MSGSAGPLKHGTATAYMYHGCRCVPCREWKSEYNRASRAARLVRAEADPSLIPHGTQSGYSSWRCRCRECRAAMSAVWERLRAERLTRRAAAEGGSPGT